MQNISLSTPQLLPQYNVCIELGDVVADRLEDGAFWWIFLKPYVFPAEENGPKLLYETVLPFLNNKPTRANLAEGVREPRYFTWSVHSLASLGVWVCTLPSSCCAVVG